MLHQIIKHSDKFKKMTKVVKVIHFMKRNHVSTSTDVESQIKVDIDNEIVN